jgi:hypothetical protein
MGCLSFLCKADFISAMASATAAISTYRLVHNPHVFEPLRGVLLTHGDFYMHLADLKAYLEADERMTNFYASPDDWVRKAILNVAGAGSFQVIEPFGSMQPKYGRPNSVPSSKPAKR